MKKTYETPELEVLLFDLREVAMENVDVLSNGTVGTVGNASNNKAFFSVDDRFDKFDDF